MDDIVLPHHIKITHNRQGRPTITARDPLGIAFAQGYVSASHRFGPMDLQRRIAAARLSEVAGLSTLAIDQWICRLGIIEAVEACYSRVRRDVEYYAILRAYSAGVNYALEHEKTCKGIEFKLMSYMPEPWTVKDSVRIMTLISWSLAGSWEEQLVRMHTLAHLGAEQAAMLEVDTWLKVDCGHYSAQRLSKSIYAAFSSFPDVTNLLSEYQAMWGKAGLLTRRSGSNAWIVGGQHTESGKPILAGDPHMPLTLPGFFYEIALFSEDKTIHAIGASIAGIPGIVIGRNATLAWSVTVAGADTAELRLERREEGEEVEAKQYVIKVKGHKDVYERVEWGTRGPFLALPGLEEVSQQHRLSLEWPGRSGVDKGTLYGLWHIMQSRDTRELIAATSQWGGPVLNLLWAEVERVQGDYGWQIIGSIPLRERQEEGILPASSETPEGQWAKGYIPITQLPTEINPPRGYIVSANQRMAPPDYPYLISHGYISGYRAERIEKLILQCIATKKYTIQNARSMQIDQTSEAALALSNIIVQAVSNAPTSTHQKALNLLKQWDGSLKAQSTAAAIFKVAEDHLYTLVAQRLFPTTPAQQDAWLGVGYTPLNPGLMSHWRMRELLFALITTRPKEFTIISEDLWPTLLEDAFTSGVEELSQRFGANPERWRWGRLHKVEINHVLVQVPIYQSLSPMQYILKKMFRLSRGPFEVGGDEHCLWQTTSYPVPVRHAQHKRRFWATGNQPVYRMIAGDCGTIYSCQPGGVSGHARHRWSDNQLNSYLQGVLLESSIAME